MDVARASACARVMLQWTDRGRKQTVLVGVATSVASGCLVYVGGAVEWEEGGGALW